jgi:hypothetical protein
VFENRVLRRIFGPKWDEVTGDWRRLHNEELHNLYPSPSIITIIKPRRMRWAGYVARMDEEECGYWWEARRKETTKEDQGCRWMDNFKRDLRKTGKDGMDCINLPEEWGPWGGLL